MCKCVKKNWIDVHFKGLGMKSVEVNETLDVLEGNEDKSDVETDGIKLVGNVIMHQVSH